MVHSEKWFDMSTTIISVILLYTAPDNKLWAQRLSKTTLSLICTAIDQYQEWRKYQYLAFFMEMLISDSELWNIILRSPFLLKKIKLMLSRSGIERRWLKSLWPWTTIRWFTPGRKRVQKELLKVHEQKTLSCVAYQLRKLCSIRLQNDKKFREQEWNAGNSSGTSS